MKNNFISSIWDFKGVKYEDKLNEEEYYEIAKKRLENHEVE